MVGFDAEAKEAALRAESETWDTTSPLSAEPGDIPIIDVGEYLRTNDAVALDEIATHLRHACESVGFWQMVGHGIDRSRLDAAFDAARDFHDLAMSTKQQIRMDRHDWPLGGVGYLPVGERKLPRRGRGNLNEAFIIKSDREILSDDNQWPPESSIPGFRSFTEGFGWELERLAKRLLPIYARALEVAPDFFTAGFRHPFWRLRMTHYPPSLPGGAHDASAFGIAPHVDTTFFTLLLQDSPGLTMYHTPKDAWIKVPLVADAFVVNSGELLRQWTNDRFLSVKHFANVESPKSRYSIPFFFNAGRDYVMECIPTCCGPDRPAKYPAISYSRSQGVVQGE